MTNTTEAGTNMQKVLDTLANLKALKDGAATPGEAEAAAAGIQRLLFKHNLEMADIVDKNDKMRTAKQKGYADHSFNVGYDTTNSWNNWQTRLLQEVAEHNFCLVVSYGSNKSIIVIGKRENVEAVKGLYEYLLKQVRILDTKTWRATYPTNYGQLSNTKVETIFKRSFREGCVTGIASALANQRKQDLEAAGSTGSSLVVDTNTELQEARDEFYGISREDREAMKKAADDAKAKYEAMTAAEKAKFDKELAARFKKYGRSKSRGGPSVDYEVYSQGRTAGAGVEIRQKLS